VNEPEKVGIIGESANLHYAKSLDSVSLNLGIGKPASGHPGNARSAQAILKNVEGDFAVWQNLSTV
jgi:hypothetical protein